MQTLPDRPRIGTPGTIWKKSNHSFKQTVMKIFHISIVLLISLSILFQSCKNTTTVNNTTDNQPSSFKSPEEAALKAKEDLLNILRTNKDVNIGLEASSLERSVTDKPLNYYTLDFSKVLQADNGTAFKDLVASQKSVVVPLTGEKEILTVIELGYVNNEYTIGTLGNKQLTSELNALNNLVSDTSVSTLAIYEIPNLNKIIYGVSVNGTETFYTNYGGSSSIERGVSSDVLLPLIIQDARKFQEQYGEQLKGEKLVK